MYQGLLLSNLNGLVKLSCRSYVPMDLTKLTALRSLSVKFSNHCDIYRVPPHVTKLSYTRCYLNEASLAELHPFVKKFKLKRFDGTLNDATKRLGTGLTDLIMGGKIPLVGTGEVNLTNESIINLPPSLTRLVILKNSTTNDAYKNLPPLKHLELDIDSRYSKITQEITQHLPQTLTYLYLANGQFPVEALKHLPQGCKVEMQTKEAVRDLA